jgi:hypothetical protein
MCDGGTLTRPAVSQIRGPPQETEARRAGVGVKFPGYAGGKLVACDRSGEATMKLLSIAGALTSLLLVVAACDDSETEVPNIDLTAEECADMGGRQSFNPGDRAPSCRDDEDQIGWVTRSGPYHLVEASRCCVPR